MISAQLKELVLQSLTHERGGVLIYKAALECAINEDLHDEWTKYLSQTQNHVTVLTNVCESLRLDAGEMTPGCRIVQHTGNSLVRAMEMALAEGDAAAAQLVACECVVLAETKDHADWELLGACARGLNGSSASILTKAVEQIEDEEDEHLYHTRGWCRELWLKSLGLEAVLPPPEDRKNVKSAAAAEKAKKQRQAVRARDGR
jgi:hypothetical protein